MFKECLHGNDNSNTTLATCIFLPRTLSLQIFPTLQCCLTRKFIACFLWKDFNRNKSAHMRLWTLRNMHKTWMSWHASGKRPAIRTGVLKINTLWSWWICTYYVYWIPAFYFSGTFLNFLLIDKYQSERSSCVKFSDFPNFGAVNE